MSSVEVKILVELSITREEGLHLLMAYDDVHVCCMESQRVAQARSHIT